MVYATYYQLVTLVFKNLDSHRGSLMQTKGSSFDTKYIGLLSLQ